MKLTSTFLAATAATLATVQSSRFTRCALEEPSAAEIAELNTAAREGAANQDNARSAARNVPVYVHVVTTTAKQARYPQRMIDDQIAALKSAYAGMGISFVVRTTDFKANDAWAAAGRNTTAERQMKTALKKGTYGELDLFFTSDTGKSGRLQTLGWCYIPVSNPSSQKVSLDGCVISADTMPGGTDVHNNVGAVAIHEVGHWFGLYHVFAGNRCSGSGDQVPDTPPQLPTDGGCPVGKDTCAGGGVDSIHNWMDYSDGICMDRFTSGQMERATSVYDSMRAGK